MYKTSVPVASLLYILVKSWSTLEIFNGSTNFCALIVVTDK